MHMRPGTSGTSARQHQHRILNAAVIIPNHHPNYRQNQPPITTYLQRFASSCQGFFDREDIYAHQN